MNQGKLDMVKQEIARVNVNLLGISEWKWTGMREFNSDDHCIYYCEQESLRRNRVALTVNESEMQYLGTISKTTEWMTLAHLHGKSSNITVIQVCAPTTNVEEVEVEQFYEDLQDLLD